MVILMKRKIYNELLKWKNNDYNVKPLMVLGARQAGKTYVIDEFCKKEYANYVYINLFENDKIVDLYNSDLNSDEKFMRLKLYLNTDLEQDNTILFIDEIQQSEKIVSELKYFCEKHNKMRIICAGSLLGVKLKRSMLSFPVGKVKMIHLYPMDFEEFLMAMDEEMLIDMIKNCYINNKAMGDLIHEKALNLYKAYLITGGMPESVQSMVNAKLDYIKYDTSILSDILNAYVQDMNKYVKNESETLKISRIYHSLPSQLANNSRKFQFSLIDKNAKSRDYKSPLDWLEASNLVLRCACVKNPEIPLGGFVDEDTYKLYLSDVGILNNLIKLKPEDILSDNMSLYKGIIAENYVANQLVAIGHDLYYWKNNNDGEVDFLLYTSNGIIPLEVKAGDSTQSKSLKVYNEKYHPKYLIRISTKDFGYDPKTKIKSIPLYAVFCLKN